MSRHAPRPLGRIVAWRIVAFAVIAMIAQLVAVIWEYGSDPENLARLMLVRETTALAGGLTITNGRLGYELPADLAERYGHDDTGYVARVRTPSGVILFSHCGAACTEHFLPLELNPPSFWLRTLEAGYPLSFAGGRTVEIEGRTVFIEASIRRDPENAVWHVLATEASEHMLVPMSLTLVFVLGATLLSIGSALRPVREAATTAERLDPMRSDMSLATAGMPLEIAQLAGAVNRSFARVQALMKAQKLFTSAIAHEIRTPLAIMRLELERIDHCRARRALDELDELSRFIDQIVALARLEAADRSGFVEIGLDTLLEELVTSIAAWVYDAGASIAFEPSDNPVIVGQPALIKDAVRNLVENAVRHGGAGVTIIVSSSADRTIAVSDDGRGFAGREETAAPGYYKPAGGLGIGLEIVRRIAELHDASLVIAPAEAGGTRAEIRFGSRQRSPSGPEPGDHS